MRLIGAVFVLAALIGPSMEEAGSFFAALPKHAPRMGRRSEFVPEKKANRMKYFYAEIPKAMPRIGRTDSSFQKPLLSNLFEKHPLRMPSWLSTAYPQSEGVDRGRDTCVTIKDILRVLGGGVGTPDKDRVERRLEFRDENLWPDDEKEEDSVSSRQFAYPSREVYQGNED